MSLASANGSQPMISVVMPVYNAGHYLAAAIDSILHQTYSRFEFIIVDDGSTDKSPEIIRDFAVRDDRIRPVFLPHVGQSKAKNHGIITATGDLIARMDADDIALPERFAVQIDWMRRTGVDVCGSCVQRFGDASHAIWFPETHEAICLELLFRVALLDPTLMMRSHVAKTNLFSEQASFTSYELFTRLARRYRLGNIQQILLMHRCHSQQINVRSRAVFFEEQRKFRRAYFFSLFPDASPGDYAALAHVADKEPSGSLQDLERAGKWLLLLSQPSVDYLRQRMADRWFDACQMSTHLGMDCWRVYRKIAPQFGLTFSQATWRLQLQCALRLRTGSRLHAILKRLKGALVCGYPRRDNKADPV